MGPHARLSPLALCRFMPRSCISAKSLRQITAPVTVRNFFCCRCFSFHRRPSPNAMPRRHASPGTRKAICPISDRKLPPGGTAIESSLPNRASSESGYAHDTPATLCMKRQTTYIFIIDISSLRLNSELWQKLLIRSMFWIWSGCQRCVPWRCARWRRIVLTLRSRGPRAGT
jgi:hypothetical protein